LADGDHTIIFISVNASSANITTPTGWTAILADTNSVNGSTSMAHAIFYRRWISGDTNPTISHSSGRVAATPVKVSGADTGAFVDVNGIVTQAASGATTITAPTITPTATVLVCSWAGRDANNGDVLDPWTSLTAGMTKIAEANGRATTQTNAGHCIAWDEVVSGNATGTKQATAAQATTGAFGVSFALNVAGEATDFNASAELAGEGSLVGFTNYLGPDTTFDGGDFEDWAETTSGGGFLETIAEAAHDGSLGARGTTPTSSDQAALTKSITPTPVAMVSGWWRVTTEGASGSNVPFARLFYGTQRLVDVYRQNVVLGSNVWLRVVKAAGGSNYNFLSTGVRLEVGEWAFVEVRWNIDGTPWMRINGTVVLDEADAPADFFVAPQIDKVYLGSHESGNAGVWDIDSVRVDTFLADVGFSGSGTLTGTAFQSSEVDADLSGSGTLSISNVTPAISKSVGLSGSGTLSSVVTPAFSKTVNLSGSGTLEVTQDAIAFDKTVPLSGNGTLSKAVVVNFTAAFTQTGSGTLTTTTNNVNFPKAIFFSGSGTLSSTQAPAVSKTVNLSGSGTLSASVVPDIAITAGLSGDGTLTATSSNSFQRSASLSGEGTLSGVATSVTLSASAALSSVGTLTGGTTTNKSVSANLSGSGALVANLTAVGFKPAASLSGSGTLSATAVKHFTASAHMSGAGQLSVTVVVHKTAELPRDGFGQLEGNTIRKTMAVSANLSGVGLLVGTPAEAQNYTFDAYLGTQRWGADLAPNRWEGDLP
jgi:hypothetical protein